MTERFEWAKHGKIYNEWFEKRKAVRPPDELVSPTGVVVNDVCIGFLCRTDSNMAIMTNFISDPDATPLMRSISLDLLIEELSKIAEQEGFFFIGASTPVKTLIEKFTNLGFMKTTVQATENFGRFYAMDSNARRSSHWSDSRRREQTVTTEGERTTG